jgi:hypothetical protein
MTRGRKNPKRLCIYAYADVMAALMQVDFRCEYPLALEDVQKENPEFNSVWCMGVECHGYTPFDFPLWRDRK